jgi:pantoate--beta-alanine ligase
LSEEERRQAPVLRLALLTALAAVQLGETSAQTLVRQVRAQISAVPAARIDYVQLVDAATLQPTEVAGPNSLLAVAVFFGETRLIDNIQLR